MAQEMNVGERVAAPAAKSLRRERFDSFVAAIESFRLGLVVGPAGSGKTTLLSQFASDTPGRVAWFKPDANDDISIHLLTSLRRALSAFLPGDESWESADSAANALNKLDGRLLLVIDDLHVIQGTEAEAELERLIQRLPEGISVLAASRRLPNFNLSRMRVSGELLEIGPDDLRFRSWEVERLFRDFYREPLMAEDLAELARRTEGWAAGLQLFHLATRGKTAPERRRTLKALGSKWRMVGEYLTRNVLDELPQELREFLVSTCVLGALSGEICDHFLGIKGSERLLSRLERDQIFTYADPDGLYHYHEVLRVHLEETLYQTLGEEAVAGLYRGAGKILEEQGVGIEALRAYSRGDDWDSVARILGREGSHLVEAGGSWLDLLPKQTVEQDPWLQLATAKRRLANGRWSEAMIAYKKAEELFGQRGGAEVSRRERQNLSAWLDPALIAPAGDWTTIVRAATKRAPMARFADAAALDGPEGALASGLCALLAGNINLAVKSLGQVGSDPDASDVVAIAAMFATGVGTIVGGDIEGARTVQAAMEEAERHGVSWLSEIGRAVNALVAPPNDEEHIAILKERARANDLWGEAIASLFYGFRLLRLGRDAREPLERAVESFRRLGAGVLEGWGLAALALCSVRSGYEDSLEVAMTAEAHIKAAGCHGLLAPVYTALAEILPEKSASYRAMASATRSEYGFAIARLMPAPARAEKVAIPERAFDVRCLGGFYLEINGRQVDVGSVKPKVRSLLFMLAANAGRPIHREVIMDSLWPEADAEAGTRNLHVAISTLRQLLEPGVARGESSLLVREADSYIFKIPDARDADVTRFLATHEAARQATASGRIDAAIQFGQQALDLYGGDLLPEAGPAEWAVAERERLRSMAAEVAQTNAELLLDIGNAKRAASAAEQGIRIDKFRDQLWRLLIKACEVSEDTAAAARARRGYTQILHELGISPQVGSSPTVRAG